MSGITGLDVNDSRGQIDEHALFQEIGEIRKKVSDVQQTARYNIQQAATFAKISSMKIGRIYDTVASYYYGLEGPDNAQRAHQNWKVALKCMKEYRHATSPYQDLDYENWLSISSLYYKRLKFCFHRQLNISTNLEVQEKPSSEEISLINKGLSAANRAFVLKASHEAIRNKFLFLQLLKEAGETTQESALVWMKSFLDTHPQPDSDDFLHSAQLYGGELAKKGDWIEAHRWSSSLLQKKEDPITYLYLGKIEDEWNHTEEAVCYFKKASLLAPESIEIKIWLIAGQVKDCIRKFNQHPHLPTQDEIAKIVGICNAFCLTYSQNLGSFNGETSTYIPVEELAAHFYTTLLPKMANVLTRLQQFPFALELYKSVLTNSALYLKRGILDPSDIAVLYTSIGGIHLCLGEFNKAEEYLLQALQTDPTYLIAYENLVVVYASQKNEASLTKLSEAFSPAVPTENDVKYLIAKENNEKSLRNGIFQPIASQTEIPPVGIAAFSLILENSTKLDQNEVLSRILFNFGTAYTLLINVSADPNYIKAELFYVRSLNFNSENWDAKLHLSRLLLIRGEQTEWMRAKELLTGFESYEQTLVFGISPERKFQIYFCLSGALALCKDIEGAKKAAIEAQKTKFSPSTVGVLQDYLKNVQNVDLQIFRTNICTSIQKLDFDFRVGKLLPNTNIIISENQFIGYHGTIDLHLEAFKDGIKACTAEIRQFKGEGFYIASDKEIASYFAMKKSREGQGGKPILLKIYVTSGKEMVGQQLPEKEAQNKKLPMQNKYEYDFIEGRINGFEMFSQRYIFENSLLKLKPPLEFEKVDWTQEDYNSFCEAWTRRGC